MPRLFVSNPRAIEVIKDKTVLYVCVATGTIPLVLPCVALSSGGGGGGRSGSYKNIRLRLFLLLENCSTFCCVVLVRLGDLDV